MSNIDKRALREAAEKALQGKWVYEAGAIWNTDESGMVQHMLAVEAGDDISDEEHKSNMRFITLATPAVVLGLLEELSESKAAEANESSCANSVIDSAIKWQTRAKDAEAKLEAAESGFPPLTVERLMREKDALEKRVVELEARMVKLPERYEVDMFPTPSPVGEWFSREDVLAALVTASVRYAAAGKGE